jgi:hypothetical protein
VSRNTHKSGVPPSTSTLCWAPLTLMVKAMAASQMLNQIAATLVLVFRRLGPQTRSRPEIASRAPPALTTSQSGEPARRSRPEPWLRQ